MKANRFILISGCSSGGKSTLLSALQTKGYAVVEEPGRRIVEQETKGDGSALPWVDMRAFARRAVEMARSDLAMAERQSGPVFFDRGLIDAAVALEHSAGVSLRETLGDRQYYSSPVFLAPPWPEIYVTDNERPHDLAEATAEYERLIVGLGSLGYETLILPKTPVKERVEFVLDALS
ncbi:AAA family ATPase [Hoeflea prorocentri]|uniref:AAA family ATPase n=1 Tax=Hoeflea prorocentri TaxID=1922333 RepID=A0A9X3ZJA2_9HYPH|nr:AAA family ATPase [Hoeflea prorocentri]MCY6383234.1 AAA family ATPase [Hoeflea prorocentri]MDA5401034.1 AAA family ATPase [Hoeflea prorocentri]